MLCNWCGEETPDESAYCLNCGEPVSEGGAPQDDGVDAPDVPDELLDDNSPAPDASPSDGFDQEPAWPLYEGKRYDAPEPVLGRSEEGDALVDGPSRPVQPRLGGGYVAVIAVIGTLFAVAVLLLGCIVLLNALGL